MFLCSCTLDFSGLIELEQLLKRYSHHDQYRYHSLFVFVFCQNKMQCGPYFMPIAKKKYCSDTKDA